jgi:hypothetical protein
MPGFVMPSSAMRVRRWHRAIAWLAGGAALVWAGSGLLHPLMTWTQPRAVSWSAPESPTIELPAPQRLSAPAMPVAMMRLYAGEDAVWLRVRSEGAAEAEYRRVAGTAGTPPTDAERATLLARHFSGEHEAAISALTLVTDFDADYPYVNRLLPVWRVDFDRADGLSAYVDLDLDRLAMLSDRRKRRLQSAFSVLHTLQPLAGQERLRLALLSLLVGSVLMMALLGAWMLARGSSRAASRRRHRWLAAAALLPALAFSGSGLLHLYSHRDTGARIDPRPPQALAIDSEIVVPAGRHDELLWTPAAGGYWRAEGAGTVRFHATDAQPMAVDEAEMAQRVTRGHGFDAIADAELLRGFTPEYGFINKRLPVWRVPSSTGALYVETRSGWLARAASPLDALEGRVFSSLHKGGVFDALGRGPRDLLLSLAAMLVALAAFSGLLLRRRRS